MQIPDYYENLSIINVNTEPLRSYYLPFSPMMDRAWSNREETDRFYSLNGEWRFRYFKNLYECKENFYDTEFDNSSFDVIPVPSNWQMLGYDQIQYTNTMYPFPFDPPYVPHDNPCGAYIRQFHYKRIDKRREYLVFEGVDSCCYVWLNGEFVGYHQVSHSMSEYDITDFIREGSNTLAVLVLKWCDGSYLEDQDKFRTNGIFRDVYILSRPEKHIVDYTIHTKVYDDYHHARLQVCINSCTERMAIKGQLMDSSGLLIGESSVTDSVLCFDVNDVRLWNAEEPNLYYLYLVTEDEVIREQIGFRTIEIKDSVVYLNGRKLRFRGVNRHDSDPIVGSAVTREHIIKDLRLMKQHNFNAIRTSHYPNAPELYEMCDKYGFYVIDEADVEIHGVVDLFDVNIFEDPLEHTFPPFICDNPIWTEPIVNRVQKMVIRDKNRPSILVWSMGNEAGYGVTFETALAWTKAYDPARLTHYEGSLHRPKDRKNDYDNIDLRSRMYASIPEMHSYLANNPDKPFIQCEYIHAMGNGPGDIEDYYQLEEQYDSYLGGFVWEWADHAIDIGLAENGTRKYLYGGDSGEYPHFGNFCVDGITTPDRRVTEGLLEYKNVHRPARIKAVAVNDGLYLIQNNMDFLNLKDYIYLEYQVLGDGVMIHEGEIRDSLLLDVEPRTKKEVSLPIQIPVFDGKVSILIREHLLNSDFFRDKGDELGFNEIIVSDNRSQVAREIMALNNDKCNPLFCEEDEKFIIIKGYDFEYTYNKHTGLFDTLNYAGKRMLEKPMELNVWRAPTDNDRSVKKLWYQAGYNMLQTRTYSNQISFNSHGDIEIEVQSSMAPVYRQRMLDVLTVWTITRDGLIIADMKVKRQEVMKGKFKDYFNQEMELVDKHGVLNMHKVNDAFLPRLGLRMFLPESMNQVEYLGYGPYESYIDKHQASYQGKFKQNVEEMFVNYIMPQENGSHFGCDYVSVTDKEHKISVCSDQPMCFNASEYTAEELERKGHNFELQKSGYTVFCIDHAQSGIGSGSCGPQLGFPYRINKTEYAYKMYIKFE